MNRSPFHNLAAELRNSIFRYVLTGDDYTIKITLDPDDLVVKPSTESSRQQVRDAYGLMSTCTQLRNECAPVFYGANAFIVQSQIPGYHYDVVERAKKIKTEELLLSAWLRCLQDHMQLLRNITLHFRQWGFGFDAEDIDNIDDSNDEVNLKASLIARVHRAISLPAVAVRVHFNVYWAWNQPDEDWIEGDVVIPLNSLKMAHEAVQSAAEKVSLQVKASEFDNEELDDEEELQERNYEEEEIERSARLLKTLGEALYALRVIRV